MNVLLTFTGFHDPYFKGLVDEEEQPGPILSLLTTRSFDHIFLAAGYRVRSPRGSQFRRWAKERLNDDRLKVVRNIGSDYLDELKRFPEKRP